MADSEWILGWGRVGFFSKSHLTFKFLLILALETCFCPSTRGKGLKHKPKLHFLPQKQVSPLFEH